MKRQKIKRYRFSVTQNTRRRRAARPLKAVGVVLVCLCLLTGAVFGIYKAIQSKTTGWHGEGLHRYYISPTTGTRAQGLYEINYKLYYFGSNNFLKTGWIEENGYVGYANADGALTQGEAKIDGKYYYFQPETGQLYTGWIMLDGVQYCFDETGHPRTGTYQEDGKVWELDSDGRVKNRLNGWKKTDGVLKYYDNSGAPAQGWTEGRKNPSVALANNGAEESKGTPVLRDAHQLLKTTPGIRFVGNIEPRDVPNGEVDVVVCDGFTGNVILKLTEGVAKMLLGMLKQMFLANLGGKLAYLLLKGGVTDLKHQMDSEEYGGAPFLGAKQPVIKAHGSSKAKGIKNAIRQAKICVENDLCGTMQSALDELAAAQKTEE